MDLKGPIVDNTIKIKPSLRLLEYIRNIPFKNDMPTNIAKVIKGIEQNTSKPVNENAAKVELDLTSDELALLSHLNSEACMSNDKDAQHDSEKSVVDTEQSMITEIKQKTEKGQKTQAKNYNKVRLMITDIDWLYVYLKELKSNGANDIPYLHELLEGSKVETPENPVLKRNPELEARCVKLRAQQEAREYRAMTKSVDNVRKHFPEDSIAYQLKQLNRQMIAIGQFLLSIFAGFLFGFKGIELMIGNFDFGLRLLLGVMCALIIALAEIYFLAKKLNEELTIPETTQLGGPVKFANQPQHPVQSNDIKNVVLSKEHQD